MNIPIQFEPRILNNETRAFDGKRFATFRRPMKCMKSHDMPCSESVFVPLCNQELVMNKKSVMKFGYTIRAAKYHELHPFSY